MKNRLLILLLCCFIAPNVYAATPMVGGNWMTSFSVQTDGTVKTWGELDLKSPPTLQLTPVIVPSLTNVKQVSNYFFLKNDGTVWGLYKSGSTSLINSQANQIGIFNVQKISAGHSHTLALKADGTVWGWADNQQGELGTGSFTYYEPTPVQAMGLTGIIDISASGSTSESSYALKNDGTVWAWGGNYYGQFGNGSTCGALFCGIPTPAKILGLSGVTAIASGYTHSVVLKNDGTVWVAGGTNGTIFKQVSGLANIVSIAAGFSSSMALKNDGSVWSFDNSSSPAASVISGLSNITSIQMGEGGGNYAVAQDGTMYAWGAAYPGNGTTGSNTPVIIGVVTAPPPVTGSSGTVQVPALSELGGMIMGALLLLISFAVQTKKTSHLR